MRREISACAGMSSISKSLNALNTGSLNRHSRLLLQLELSAVREGRPPDGVTLLAPSSAPTSYHSATPSESQRSCAAAVWVLVSLSGSPAMKRPPTVETLFGPAAAIMVACAWSGSVWAAGSCCSTTTFYSFFMSFLRSRVHSRCAEQLLCRWSHSVSTSSRLTLVSTFCRGVSKQVEWPQATLCAVPELHVNMNL
jgi:hypothetical protein